MHTGKATDAGGRTETGPLSCVALVHHSGVMYSGVMSESRIYWHIAHPSYSGGDLRCRNYLVRDGVAPEWAWPDAPEGFDGNVVSLFSDTPCGREEADWLWYERPDYTLLRVTIPADVHDEILTEGEEGYPAVEHQIPEEWVTEVRRGYAAGVLQ